MAEDHDEREDVDGTPSPERRILTDAPASLLVYPKDWKEREYGLASNMRAKARGIWALECAVVRPRRAPCRWRRGAAIGAVFQHHRRARASDVA
jgi:hypothetical protein